MTATSNVTWTAPSGAVWHLVDANGAKVQAGVQTDAEGDSFRIAARPDVVAGADGAPFKVGMVWIVLDGERRDGATSYTGTEFLMDGWSWVRVDKPAATAGQQLAATLRRLHKVGTRTRRYRGNLNVVDQMLDDINTANVYPGYFTGDTHAALTAASAIYRAWQKHVEGCRIRPELRAQIKALSPWQTANLLGRMVDAGITNNFEAELWFAQLKLA